MKVLDDPPRKTKTALLKAPQGAKTNSFAQYEALFLQLADEHKTINIFELQELLDACLPNDYIKSCASIDTCRQIVLSLDVSFFNVTAKLPRRVVHVWHYPYLILTLVREVSAETTKKFQI